MQSFLRLAAVTGLTFFTAFTVSAQAPPNDAFANAIPLNGPIVTTTGSNVGATKQFGGPGGGEPFLIGGNDFSNFGGASVWWTWTATASGQTTIDTEGSSFDTLLGVYTGTAANQLALVADSNNYNGNTWSRVEFNAVAGTVYRILVDGLRMGGGPGGRAAQGDIVLNVKGVGGIVFNTPTNGMVFTVGDPIPVSVTIDSDFPNLPATRVDFYVGDNLFASSTAAPFSAVATNVPAGSNRVYVIAFDNASAPVQSPVVNVFVQSIGVTLLTPFEDTVFLNTDPITVTAWAYLPAGAITNIEFFVDGVKFGEDDAPPYSASWSNVVGGSHRFTVVGWSDTGERYTSQALNIGVATTLMPFGSVWKYLDNGSDQGTAWIAPDFDDSSWASGPAPLGYSDSNGRPPATTNSFGPDANAKYTTTYYRQAIVTSNAASFGSLTLNIERDDGAVVYLNGAELGRFNMPTGAVTYTTFASVNANDDGGTVFSMNLDSALLGDGTNVFAVEIHQDVGTSSDIWFRMSLVGLPVIIHNLSPLVVLTSPTNNTYFLAPSEIALEATASDEDGSVAKVEFFADGVKVGESTNAPYSANWNNPLAAAHVLTAVATDDQGSTTTSEEVPIVVYDAAGTPVAKVTTPPDGHIVEGPTNMLVTATANAITGVTNVQFLANGIEFGNDDTAPYSAIWPAPFGTNILTAVVTDANGVSGTSPPVTIVITIPPTNVIAPTIATQNPLAGATVTNLTSLTVIFSERALNVDAADLLINGVAATNVTGNGSLSNYTFTFPQPPYGAVNITWASGHGITDYGYPSNLPFDENGPGATWSYDLIDRTPPNINTRTPAAGSTVTNLTEISIAFSEAVSGVDAADLLVNGVPASGVSGGGANYTFSLPGFGSGLLNVTWATNHEIFDLALMPNRFNGSNANARWSFTLDTRFIYIQTNSIWRFIKGTNEASSPTNAWRQLAYDDSGWSNAPAPFFYGETSLTNANYPGTTLSDMQSNYTSIYLRSEFTVENRGNITNLLLFAQADDGFIAWINGVQMLRVNMPAGEVPYNATATVQANEPQNNGAAWVVYALPSSAAALVDGRNVLAVHAFNQNLTNSSDFSFNAQLYTFLIDPSTVGPRLLEPVPTQGDLFSLTNIIITFSEPVSGVNAADLLVNGAPAVSVSTTTNTTYSFGFAPPAYGPVVITWETNHGILDFDGPPRAFNGEATNSILRYFLINPSNPKIATQSPLAGSTVTGLTAVVVTFTEPVSGVEASDLLVNDTPAETVTSADDTTYRFTFLQPPFGSVQIRWATNHSIVDIEAGNGFDPTRFGGQWNYTLIDPVPSVTLTSPTNNTYFLPPANITLRANATDNDGTIALVEFYESDNKLGEGTNAPYTLDVFDLAVGTYVFHAVATDNIGLMRTSAPVVLNVVTSLPITLVRGPYLQIGSPTGGVVRWRTDAISDALVFYGTDVNNLTNVAVELSITNEHIVTVSGLEPDTRYFYSIGSAGYRLVGGTNDGANYWFKTSPVPGTRKPTRLWVLGDAGTAGNGPPDRQQSTRDAYYNFAATNGPADIWLMLGDNAYNSGTDAEHQSAIFDMYPTTLRNLFLWPTIGNHETSQSFTATDFPYLHIFSLPQNGEAGGLASGSEKYYSFDYADIHFICLDSMSSGRATNTAMVQWLVNDLAATAQYWTIVFFHHPPYTRGNHNSDNENELIEIRQNILPILEDNGVDLVLCGHSHDWERSYFLHGHYGLSGTLTDLMKIDGGDGREDGTGAYRKNGRGQGVVYTVAGNAGQVTGGQLNHPAHFLSLNELGTMIIDVTSARIDVMMLAPDGTSPDHYTIIKVAPVAVPANLIARALGGTDVALTWADMATNELGYVIERSIDGVNFVRIATNDVNVTNALDHGLLANTTYFYRVRAFSQENESNTSNIASVTTVTVFGAPQAPSGLFVSAGNGGDAYRSQMFLRWNDHSPNEAGFLIERSYDGSTFSPIATVSADMKQHVDHDLESATVYSYRVRSFNLWGDSTPSNVDVDQTHPQDDIVLAGDSVTFHAGVDGVPPIQYQWRFMGNDISGATNEALTIADAQLADEGEYTVLIADATDDSVSNPAWLFVFAPPIIVEHPANRTNVIGSSISFHVVADGTPLLFYQWRRNGLDLPGANGEELAIAHVTVADQGTYDVVVANSFGVITSEVAYLSVNTPPMAGPDLVSGFHDEDLLVNVATLLANDVDIDSEPIFVTAVSPNSSRGGTVTINGTELIYSPPGGYTGEDTFTYVLTDSRGASGLGLVTVSVGTNNAPVLAAIPDAFAYVLTPLVINNVATDSDGPASKLTYSLGPGAPTDARINPTTGLFRWTPTRGQAPSTNLIIVKVSDNGIPSRDDAKSFTVIVNDYLEVTAGSTVTLAGTNAAVPIDLFSSAELLDLQCLLQFPGERLTNLSVEDLAPQVATVSLQMSDSNTAALTFTATPGQTLQGTQHLARLHFTAVAGQNSVFAPLHLGSMSATRAGTDPTPTLLANDGRIVILGEQSLLDAHFTAAGQRELTLYGKMGVTYTIQYSTNLMDGSSWRTRGLIVMTNLSRLVFLGNNPSTNFPSFFRVRR